MWIILVFAAVQLLGLGWDLPGAYGWENDGVAPRDLFGGLAHNLSPGQAHRYPLLHYLILAVLCLPVALVVAAGAGAWTAPALTAAMLQVAPMTAISIVAKLVAVVMGCVAVATLARIAARTVSPRAGRMAALFAATSVSVSYYGRVSNLDLPYLMWTALALNALIDVAEHGRLRDYLRFGIFTGAAVATKDQAYASFVLVGPLYLIALPALGRGLAVPARIHWRRLLAAVGAGALSLGVLGGGLLNPTGFVAHIELLTGPNSQDWRAYAPGLAGVWANLRDLAAAQAEFWWPWPVVALAWLGVVLAWAKPAAPGSPQTRAWRMLPLVAGVSSVLAFTLVVARTEHRFVLPLGFWLAYYGGVAVDVMLDWDRLRTPVRIALVGLLAWSAGRALAVPITQWCDARREVSRMLAALPPGSTVETYGLLTYLPHFDVSPQAPYRVQRVGPEPPAERNPLLGAAEIQAPYGEVEARRPDVLVIPEGFAVRFLPQPDGPGQRRQAVVEAYRRRSDGAEFFRAAVADELPGYRLRAVVTPTVPAWLTALGLGPVEIHGSTGRRVWVLEAAPARSGEHAPGP
ncbi:ArnT family glycosyltransferase [Haliangium sp.]|uniref:ArnT family glycosyltransferase n=1 Tax=Haliangium sp. TaxID=2663208 RepID=UPI003D09E156